MYGSGPFLILFLPLLLKFLAFTVGHSDWQRTSIFKSVRFYLSINNAYKLRKRQDIGGFQMNTTFVKWLDKIVNIATILLVNNKTLLTPLIFKAYIPNVHFFNLCFRTSEAATVTRLHVIGNSPQKLALLLWGIICHKRRKMYIIVVYYFFF